MDFRERILDAVNTLRGVRASADSSMPSYVMGSSSCSFGQTIDDSDRIFAVQREPIAHRVVYIVAHDVFDKWFKVVDTAEKPDEGLDTKVQDILSSLDTKRVFTEAAAFERMCGWSIVALGFRDGSERARRHFSRKLFQE